MKYCIKTTNGTLPISEDEIEKVAKAMDKKMIVVLQAGIVNGAFISEVVRDLHAEKEFNYGYKFQGDDHITRKDYITDIKDIIKKLDVKDIKLISS